MIHVDYEKDIVEFEGNGGQLLKEMALVLTLSLKEQMEALPEEKDFNRIVDMVTDALGGMVKAAVASAREDLMAEGETEDEEGHVTEERNRESIRTNIKQFRRGRKGRSLS